MNTAPIKTLKNGEYIKRKADAQKVYIRGEYCREAKAYACRDAEDINREILIKGSTPVFFGFTY